jgi:hypothetical protein
VDCGVLGSVAGYVDHFQGTDTANAMAAQRRDLHAVIVEGVAAQFFHVVIGQQYSHKCCMILDWCPLAAEFPY